MSATDLPVLELDERRRASLGRIGNPEHRRYLVEERNDGTIVLYPAVVMTQLEARFLANRRLVERVEDNRRHPERLIRRSTGRSPAESTAASGRRMKGSAKPAGSRAKRGGRGSTPKQA